MIKAETDDFAPPFPVSLRLRAFALNSDVMTAARDMASRRRLISLVFSPAHGSPDVDQPAVLDSVDVVVDVDRIGYVVGD